MGLRHVLRPALIGIGWLILLLMLGGLLIWGWRFSQPLWQELGLTWDERINQPLWSGFLLLSLLAGLAGGVFLLYRAQRQDQRAMIQAERETAWAMAKDQEEEIAWQRYLDTLTRLLLEQDLWTLAADSKVRYILRARTLALLHEVNDSRKGHVLRFLYETRLIDRKDSIINLQGADLNWADLAWADLRGANLGGVDLRGAALNGADLMGVNLIGADLTGADLIAADLPWADLRGASLARADLRGAMLHWIDLREADLAWADLREASLNWADLRGADLHGANLGKASLEGAILSSTNLKGATLNEVIMPDGRKKGLFTSFDKFID